MAIDSQELVDRVLLGYGEAGTTIVPPVSIAGARWEPTGDELMAFDLDAANQLLEDNGYEDTDGDGVREMPDGGRPLDFRYYVRSEENSTVKASEFIKEWLAHIGIATDVKPFTHTKLTDVIY